MPRHGPNADLAPVEPSTDLTALSLPRQIFPRQIFPRRRGGYFLEAAPFFFTATKLHLRRSSSSVPSRSARRVLSARPSSSSLRAPHLAALSSSSPAAASPSSLCEGLLPGRVLCSVVPSAGQVPPSRRPCSVFSMAPDPLQARSSRRARCFLRTLVLARPTAQASYSLAAAPLSCLLCSPRALLSAAASPAQLGLQLPRSSPVFPAPGLQLA